MRRQSGQTLVEAVSALVCLLVLLAGLFVSARAISLTGSVESAAFTQTLREGRRQTNIGDIIANTILPQKKGISIRTERKRVSSLLPSILPAPEGRTRSIVRIDKDWQEAGMVAPWPSLSTERWIEASVDCWGRQAPTGIKTTTALRTYILLGAIP